MTQPAPVRPRRKWPVRVLLVFLIAIGLVAILLATGLPQPAILRGVLGSALGARVEVGSVQVLGAVAVSRLAIYAPGDPEGTPAVLLEGLVLDYSLRARRGRHISSLTFDRLEIDVEKAQRFQPKKEPGKASPSTPEASRANGESWIPERVEIRSLNVKSTAASYSFETQNLRFSADIPSAGQFQAALSGDDVAVLLWTRAGGFGREISGGRVNITVAKSDNAVTVQPLEVALPGLLEIIGSASVAGHEVAIEFEKMTAQDVDLTRADPADLAAPFGFKQIDMSGAHVKGDMQIGALSISMPESSIRFVADDLVLGPQGAEYYRGDLTVEVLGAAGAEADYTVTATLDRGQKLAARFKGHHLAFSGRANVEGWSREDVLEALPANMRGGISYLPLLRRVDSAALDFEWKAPVLKITGGAAALFVVDGEERTAQARLDGEGPVMPADQRALAVKAVVQLGGGEVGATTTLGGTGAAKTTLSLDKIDPALWLYTLNERDMINNLHARLSGTVEIEPGGGPNLLRAAVDLRADRFGYGPVLMPDGETLAILGNIEANLDTFGYVRGPELAFKINDDSELILRQWNFPMGDFSLSGDVACKLDLALLEPMLPGSDIRGRIAVEGPLRNDRGYMNLDFTGSIEGLGYGDYAAPYGAPIGATGTFVFDNLNGRLTGRKFSLNLPEATSVVSDGWTFEGSTARFAAPFVLETDLEPLARMGLLDTVGGGAVTATGTFSYGEGGARIEANIDGRAETLVAGGARAALTGVTIAGNISNAADGVVRGQADAAAESAASFGAVFEGIKGPVKLERDVVRADLGGRLYGGTVHAEAEAALLTEHLPVRLHAQVADVDLELFTQTLGVPTVEMTGLANGEATLAMHYPAGIQDFDANLISTRNFSVSVGLLERLLALQFAKQYAGERQMERVKAKILGKESQRPFDSGQLVLDYEQERIGGEASLKSEGLDLTVDLKIDTEAFFSAIKLAQEARIERLGLESEPANKE